MQEPTDAISLASMSIAEGRDSKKIDAVAQLLQREHDIRLIHVRPEVRLNRTQLLFGGEPQALLDAAMDSVAVIHNQLGPILPEGDVRPFGALEMLSFMPLRGNDLTVENRLARAFAERVSEAYELPVYLAGEGALREERRNLKTLLEREGEGYTIAPPEGPPDFGPEQAHPRMGISLVCARYLHLNCVMYFDSRDMDLIEDLTQVHKQVAVKGEQGRAQDYQDLARLLPNLSLYVDEVVTPRMVRLWCNIRNPNLTPLMRTIDVFRQAADQVAAGYLGSRILGFVPLEYLHCLSEDAGRAGSGEEEKIGENDLQYILKGLSELNLGSLEPFRPRFQILDGYFDGELWERLPSSLS